MIYLENDSTFAQRIYIPRGDEAIPDVTGHTFALQSKDYRITENGTTRIHPDGGFDGISAGTIGVYVSAATGVTFQHLTVEENGLYVPSDDNVYTGVTVNVDTTPAYNSGYTEGYSDGYDTGFTEGYATGYTEGETAGYGNGYQRGLVDGGETGYTSGYTVGYAEGYATGYTSGETHQKSLLSTATITENGTTTYENGVSAVTVDVTTGGTGVLTSATFTQNGTMLPPEGYDGWSAVTVNVPNDYAEGYDDGIAYQKSLLASTAITSNGEFTSENGWSSITINVPSSGYTEDDLEEAYSSGYTQGYKEGSGDVADMYLTIRVLTGGTITFDFTGYPVQAKIDNQQWFNITSTTLTFTEGTEIKLKGSNTTYGDASHIYSTDNCRWEVLGNIMSLFYDDNFSGQTEFPSTASTLGRFFTGPNNSTNWGPVSAKSLLLPADVLMEGCYGMMFYFCKSLTKGPALNASTLAPYCYFRMFEGTILSEPIMLPATKMEPYCYAFMFGATPLPRHYPLPAVALAEGCYQYMFHDCLFHLHHAPYLPATDIAPYAYYAMYDHSGLYEMAEMPALNIVEQRGCAYMYHRCPDLTGVSETIEVTTIRDNGMQNMFADCDTLTDASSLAVQNIGNYGCASMYSGCVSLTGVPETYKVRTIGWRGMQYMFSTCLALGISSSISADTIGTEGCAFMYFDCTNLHNDSTRTGETYHNTYIKANNIGPYAFRSMFEGTALYVTPQILTPISEGCYKWMFAQIPSNFDWYNNRNQLTATTLAPYCYEGMFADSDFSAAEITLPATTLAQGCYKRMFASIGYPGFTKVTLPATVLADNCYQEMFDDSRFIDQIICAAEDISAQDCTTNWTRGVASSGTFKKSATMTLWTTGDNGIPANWNVTDI